MLKSWSDRSVPACACVAGSNNVAFATKAAIEVGCMGDVLGIADVL